MLQKDKTRSSVVLTILPYTRYTQKLWVSREGLMLTCGFMEGTHRFVWMSDHRKVDVEEEEEVETT